MGLILRPEDDELIADEMFRVSLAYEYGQYGLYQDYEKALKHFTLSAEDGLDRSQFYLADMYYSGKGVEKDVSLALKWVEKSLTLVIIMLGLFSPI